MFRTAKQLYVSKAHFPRPRAGLRTHVENVGNQVPVIAIPIFPGSYFELSKGPVMPASCPGYAGERHTISVVKGAFDIYPRINIRWILDRVPFSSRVILINQLFSVYFLHTLSITRTLSLAEASSRIDLLWTCIPDFGMLLFLDPCDKANAMALLCRELSFSPDKEIPPSCIFT